MHISYVQGGQQQLQPHSQPQQPGAWHANQGEDDLATAIPGQEDEDWGGGRLSGGSYPSDGEVDGEVLMLQALEKLEQGNRDGSVQKKGTGGGGYKGVPNEPDEYEAELLFAIDMLERQQPRQKQQQQEPGVRAKGSSASRKGYQQAQPRQPSGPQQKKQREQKDRSNYEADLEELIAEMEGQLR